MKVAAAGAEAAQPVASARQGLLPAEEVAAASGAKAQPWAAVEVLPVPSVRQPEAGVAELAVPVQPPEAAVAGSGVAEPRRAEVAAARPDAAGRQRGEEAVARPDVEALQPAAEARAPSVLPPAVAHPSAAVGLPWPCHRPWLAPRQAERTAHAMRRPRTASPSRQLWRAAKCGAWS